MNKNPVLCLLGLILIFSGLAWGESLIRVGIADRAAVQDIKVCFTDISRVEPYAVTGSATEEGIQSLRAKGYAVEVLVPDEQAAALKAVSQPPEPAIPGVFHSYPWMCALLDTIARQHPTLCRLDTIGTSFGGRRILALRITSNPTQEQNKPEILWEGGIHGDEIMGPEVCLNLINALTDSYALSSRIQRYVDTREIWVAPNVNPDGRVNMSRYNGNNVDLNRNYGYNWDVLETGGGAGPFSDLPSGSPTTAELTSSPIPGPTPCKQLRTAWPSTGSPSATTPSCPILTTKARAGCMTCTAPPRTSTTAARARTAGASRSP